MGENRPTWVEYYLNIAAAVAARSTCLRRQYGAVIVKGGKIVATGYNGSPKGEINCCDSGVCQRTLDGSEHNSGDYSNCHSVHAEQNALMMASKEELDGATLYLWGGENGKEIKAIPCPICSRMISNSGIKLLYGSGMND